MGDFTLIESNDGAMVVCEAIRSLRDIAQSCEEQRTRRYEISQQCKIAAEAIEKNAEVLMKAIGSDREYRMRLLDNLDKIFEMPSIDENVVKLAERLLDHLERTSAVAVLRSAPPIQIPISIGIIRCLRHSLVVITQERYYKK